MANRYISSPRKMLPFWVMAVSALLIVMSVSLGVLLFLHRQNTEQALQQITKHPSQNGLVLPTSSSIGLISRGVPAFSSRSWTPSSNANDSSYDTSWRSQGTPAWLAYDLSGVPVTDRGKVLVVWYNQTGNYNHIAIKDPAYNNLKDYTIEVNAAAGGSDAPTSGWVVRVRVTGNAYHSRQHLIDMNGYNWIRIHVTAADGSIENMDASINMDVYTAEKALGDDWIFYGDSITAAAMSQSSFGGTLAFANLINAKSPDHFPVQEDGGIGYLTSSDGVRYINTWLSLFPGKYVGLGYGTNDANACVDPNIYYSNYVMMVQAVLKAKKIPIVPILPWGRTSAIQKCGPALVQKIEALYQAFPQIIHGPDLWTFFKTHQNLISNDNIHPNDQGMGACRQQWADQLLSAIYQIP